MTDILIVGGGIAGLSFGYESRIQGYDAEIVERLEKVGGMCRSFVHNGCYLDVGVHLFYGNHPKVLKRAQELIPADQWVKINRNGNLYIKGRHIAWPLRLKSIVQFPFILGVKVFWEQLTSKKIDANGSSYESEITSLYGRHLYDSFFGPFTKKFLKQNPRDIHCNWALASIRAATKLENEKEETKYIGEKLDKETRNNFHLLGFLWKTLTSKREEEPFYYFKKGYGVLPDSYRDAFLNKGGRISVNQKIEELITEEDRIVGCRINGEVKYFKHIVWTGMLEQLCELLGEEKPNTKRLNSKFIYAFLKRSKRNHQVCYYADETLNTVRATLLNNQYQGIIQNPKISDVVCLEYTYETRSDMEAIDQQAAEDLAIKDLLKADLVWSKDDVESMFQLNIPNSYPIFSLNYDKKIEQVKKNILNRYKNITLFGRQGNFSYENADGIIQESIEHPFFQENSPESLKEKTSTQMKPSRNLMSHPVTPSHDISPV